MIATIMLKIIGYLLPKPVVLTTISSKTPEIVILRKTMTHLENATTLGIVHVSRVIGWINCGYYTDFFKTHVKIILFSYFDNKKFCFQQDNALVHTSN